MRQPYELTDWNDAEFIGVHDLPSDFAFNGVRVASPSDTSASWQPQMYTTAEGYIGARDLESVPRLGAAPPTKDMTNLPRFDVTVDASPHEIATTCRTRAEHTVTRPIGYVAIRLGMRSIDVAATQTLPDGIGVSLHLSDGFGKRQNSITSLRVDMPGEASGAFTFLARGGSGKFDQVRISGNGVERRLLEQGTDVHSIGSNLSALRSDQDTARLIGYLSGILATDLSLPLNRHATALRLYETMGRDDFSVLGTMVQAQGAEYGVSTEEASKPHILGSLLRPFQKHTRGRRK